MKQSKITFLTSVGAGLEYYDLVIYSLLAKFISQQFFPSSNYTASLFATFGVFALGNIVRPLGGVIFGILGDRFGRKNVFANTLLWMAIATFLMGLTPTFATLGLGATIFFSICRILQGLTFGAELPGALTMLAEHVDPKRHGLHFGFMISAVSLGVTFGSFINWLLAKILPEDQIMAWGFRLPFLLGGSLALVGFYVRKHVPETPAFLAQQKSKIKITATLFKEHIWQILNVIGIVLFPASFITFFLVLPTYLESFYHYQFSDVYLAMTIGCLWCVILIPTFGWLSDNIGRRILLIAAPLALIIFGLPIYSLLRSETQWALYVFVLFGETVISVMSSSYFVLLPQAFKTAIRFTGTAISYNISFVLAASIPLVVNYFYGVVNRPTYVMVVFMLLAVLMIVSTLMLKVKKEV